MSSTQLASIEHFRGDTGPIGFVVVDVDGAPVDVTGRTYRLTVSRRRAPSVTEAPAAEVAQAVGAITDAPVGRLTFSFLATDFDSVGPGEYGADGVAALWYDLEQVDGAQIFTLGRGSFRLIQDVTK